MYSGSSDYENIKYSTYIEIGFFNKQVFFNATNYYYFMVIILKSIVLRLSVDSLFSVIIINYITVHVFVFAHFIRI